MNQQWPMRKWIDRIWLMLKILLTITFFLIGLVFVSLGSIGLMDTRNYDEAWQHCEDIYNSNEMINYCFEGWLYTDVSNVLFLFCGIPFTILGCYFLYKNLINFRN